MGDDDFCAVIHPSFGGFPEAQLMALDLEKDFRSGFLFLQAARGTVCMYVLCFYHDVPPSRSVAGVAQGADLGLGLVFKVQLHIFDTYLTSPWEHDSRTEKKRVKQQGITC